MSKKIHPYNIMKNPPAVEGISRLRQAEPLQAPTLRSRRWKLTRTVLLLMMFFQGLLLSVAGQVVRAGDVNVVINDTAQMTIAYDEPGAQADANRLQDYINRMTGVTLSVVDLSTNPQGALILVGPEAAASVNVTITQSYPGGERVVAKEVSGDLVMAGNDAEGYTGTRHAIDMFLAELGTEAFGPDTDWHVVKSYDDLVVSNLNIDVQPAFEGRSTFFFMHPYGGVSHPDFDKASWGNGGTPYHITHNFYQMYPAATYFSPHPEWYALVDSERVSWGQMCLSNTDVQDRAIELAIDHFDADPAQVMFSLTANDGQNFCECASCIAMGDNTSGRNLAFANIVVAGLREEHATKDVAFCAYLGTHPPPTTVTAADGVEVFLVDQTCPVHHVNHEGCQAGGAGKAGWKAWLDGWQAKDVDLSGIYEYYLPSFGGWKNVPYVPGDAALTDLQYYEDEGIRYMYYQGDQSEVTQDAPIRWPLAYVASKGMWDPDQTATQILQPACEKLFGDASTPMLNFYLECAKALDDSTAHGPGWWGMPSPELVYTPQVVTTIRGQLHQAWENAAGESAAVKGRVKDVIDCWRKAEGIVLPPTDDFDSYTDGQDLTGDLGDPDWVAASQGALEKHTKVSKEVAQRTQTSYDGAFASAKEHEGEDFARVKANIYFDTFGYNTIMGGIFVNAQELGDIGPYGGKLMYRASIGNYTSGVRMALVQGGASGGDWNDSKVGGISADTWYELLLDADYRVANKTTVTFAVREVGGSQVNQITHTFDGTLAVPGANGAALSGGHAGMEIHDNAGSPSVFLDNFYLVYGSGGALYKDNFDSYTDGDDLTGDLGDLDWVAASQGALEKHTKVSKEVAQRTQTSYDGAFASAKEHEGEDFARVKADVYFDTFGFNTIMGGIFLNAQELGDIGQYGGKLMYRASIGNYSSGVQMALVQGGDTSADWSDNELWGISVDTWYELLLEADYTVDGETTVTFTVTEVGGSQVNQITNTFDGTLAVPGANGAALSGGYAGMEINDNAGSPSVFLDNFEMEYWPCGTLYAPWADPGGPYTIEENASLTLDASWSMDLNVEDEIVSYLWDMDDNGVYETDAGDEAELILSYAQLTTLGLGVGGPYDIHLKVVDNTGLFDTASTQLTITAPEPFTLAVLLLGGLGMLMRRRP